jgi:hypothetical protein
LPPVGSGQVCGESRQRRNSNRLSTGFVKRLILCRRDSEVPVGVVIDAAGSKKGVDETGRAQVVQDAGHVLAADQVDVINAKVRRDNFVARCPSTASPFDNPRRAESQGVRGGQKSRPIRKASAQLGGK